MRKWKSVLFWTFICTEVSLLCLCWFPVPTSSTSTVNRGQSSLFNCSSPNCTDINECENNPCQNGATCEDQIGQFQCHCPLGFAGNTCSENIDECATEPCLNGGTCIDGIASYTCTCPMGLLGPNCSKDIDECLSLPCLHGGQCEDKIGGFVCHCVNGWSGANCEFDMDECESIPCQHGGRCEDKVGDYECHCMGLWSGKNCDINLDPCSGEEACLNNATCLNQTEGNFTCHCQNGFTGQFCELDIDECLLEPCHNDGRCENTLGSYDCHCPLNFGGKNCVDSFDNCLVNPCQHGGSCHSSPPNSNFTCICPEGFTGMRCETNINECEGIICPSNQECVDMINDYRCQCPQGFDGPSCELNVDDCAESPCRNNGICVDAIGNFSCRCPKGFTGHRCELDVDECTINRTSPCHRGICVNKMGSFQCYCSQGYTGQLCDHEYDECLPRPCKNGGICRDLVANYKCICPVGYTGRNCETEIDECAMAPCLNNATCNDKVGSFNCDCAPGFTGILCEEDIDECISSPCLHTGKCVDKVNGFLCDCDDTGFKGEICQENIDDCVSNPCVHDSNCTDQIKNYTCSCHFGFSGQNCEVDVAECEERPCLNGGSCLEKSNHTIYEILDTLRPAGFPIGPYSHATAGGYLCTCPRGFTGENCEINIDDCGSHQCKNGVCVDGVDAYSCRCHQGFEGRYCEIEIDECRRIRPCFPGSICVDLIGDYRCNCPNGIGGKNCTVALLGCEQHDCQNGATCIPYLIGEDQHMKNCSCATGFYGTVCEHSTAISFDGSQKLTIIGNASRDYHLNFRFRTTLPNGLLVFGYGQTHYYLIYLRNASVHLFVENVGNEISLTRRKVNNGQWWTIRVGLLDGGLLLKLSNDSSNEEVVINKTIDMTSSAVSKPTFTGTVMGGVDSWMASLSARFNLHGFIGCMEDVMMSGETIVPRLETKKISSAVSVISNVSPNCIRTPQCFPNTCNGGGVCIDLWNNYSCNCYRPHYGQHCEQKYESVTFGRGNVTDSLVEVNIPSGVSQVLRNDTTVSLFLRTRKGDGLIFYLGNGDSMDGASDDDTFLAAELESGLLRVSVKINGTPESLVDKLGQRLDDGYYHFLQVSLVDRTLSASINDTTLFRMGVEASKDKYLVASSLYLGGLPVPTVHRRIRRQTLSNLTISPPMNLVPPLQELTPLTAHVAFFKGVLQDVRVNKWRVEFFNVSNEILPRNILRNVSNFNVIAGVQSDDTCHPNPCSNGSACTVTWNDYHCECAKGFRGKNCTDKEYCAFFSCPENSECRSLLDGYECVSNATFNGFNSTVILVPRISSLDTFSSTLTFYYRTQIGGSILNFSDGVNSYLHVGLLNATRFKLRWINGAHLEEHEINLNNVNDGDWHFISVVSRDKSLFVEVDDDGKTQKISPVADWNLSSYLIKNTTSVVVGEHYRGCLRDVRLGSILLPFLPRSALLNDTSSNYFDALNLEHIGINECQLCYDHECSRQSTCLDKYASYQCNCSEGFTGQLCEVDIDECESIVCANGGSCIDAIANFSCRCVSGYEGAKCEIEIDECNSNPCQNGGICIDLINSYNCSCLSNYTGSNCEKEKAFDCSAHPCHRGSTCLDVTPEGPGEAAYQCICPIGFTGPICDTEINFCQNEPCKNGATCINQPHFGTFQCMCAAGFEGIVCGEKVNHCKSTPCHNGGTCHPVDQSYTCSCLSTHTGINCDEDVNECEIDNIMCLHGGTCHNLEPGYECLCTINYFGPNCSYFNVCVEAPCVNGECYPKQISNVSYIPNCTCDPGYIGEFCDEEDQGSNTQMLAIVVGSVVATTVLIIVVALVVFLTMAKKKRATRGTYSPSRQEMFGSRVEMGNVMKPPPEERLI